MQLSSVVQRARCKEIADLEALLMMLIYDQRCSFSRAIFNLRCLLGHARTVYLVGDLEADSRNCTDEQALGNRQDHMQEQFAALQLQTQNLAVEVMRMSIKAS